MHFRLKWSKYSQDELTQLLCGICLIASSVCPQAGDWCDYLGIHMFFLFLLLFALFKIYLFIHLLHIYVRLLSRRAPEYAASQGDAVREFQHCTAVLVRTAIFDIRRFQSIRDTRYT